MFATVLVPSSLLRLWDIILVYGFDIFHRFGAAFISLHERSLIKQIKTELKNLKTESCADALIIAVNRALKSSVAKICKIKIEVVIKKILKKPNYSLISRYGFLLQAQNAESSSNYRLIRITQTKKLLNSIRFEIPDLQKIIELLSNPSYKAISFEIFQDICIKNLNWTVTIALNVFNTLDELGADLLKPESFTKFLPLFLSIPLKKRLKMIFKTLACSKITTLDFISTLYSFEHFIDPYSKAYSPENTEITTKIAKELGNKIETRSIHKILFTSKLFEYLIRLLLYVDKAPEEVLNTRIADITASGVYSNIHSPVRSCSSSSQNSEEKFLKEIEKKLLSISQKARQGDEALDSKEKNVSYGLGDHLRGPKTQDSLLEDYVIHENKEFWDKNEDLHKNNTFIRPKRLSDSNENNLSTKISDQIQTLEKTEVVDVPVHIKANRNCSRQCSNQCDLF